MPAAPVTRWHDGLIVYAKAYLRRDDALKDLGVSESELEPISRARRRADPGATAAVAGAAELSFARSCRQVRARPCSTSTAARSPGKSRGPPASERSPTLGSRQRAACRPDCSLL
jgi:hypothetical protein